MKKILVFMLTFVLAATTSAQVRVTGRVTALSPYSGGAGGGPKPVSDVIVKLVSGTETLAFTSSNAQGVYNLEVKNAPSGERLRVGERSSGMEHYRQSQEAERMGRDYMAYCLEQVKSRIIARYQQKGGIGVTDI